MISALLQRGQELSLQHQYIQEEEDRYPTSKAEHGCCDTGCRNPRSVPLGGCYTRRCEEMRLRRLGLALIVMLAL
jgi:hypothetical protein